MSNELFRKAVAPLLCDQESSAQILAATSSTSFPEYVSMHGLGPILYAQLKRRGLIDQVPATVAKALKQAYTSQLLIEDLRQLELRRIARALEKNALPSLIVKGAAFAYTLYPEPHLRMRGDTDFLISEPSRQAVARVLESLGYSRELQIPGELAMYQEPYSRQPAPGFNMVLDVHWRLSNQEVFARIFAFDELCKEAVSIPALGLRTISDVDALVLAGVHRVAHHKRSRALIWLYDMYLLSERMSEHELQVWAEKVTRLRVVEVCRDGLLETLEDFPGANLQKLLDLLPEKASGEEPSQAFLGKQSDLELLWSDFSSLSGWQRFRWLREQLLPPLDYMRSRYRTGNPLRLAYLYVWRVLHGLWARSKARSS